MLVLIVLTSKSRERYDSSIPAFHALLEEYQFLTTNVEIKE